MLNKWKTYRFEEIAELRKKQIVPNGEEQPYIGLEHIEQQSLRLNGVGSSKDVISNKLKFYEGDILYGKLRPYFRKVYKPKFEGVCSTDIYVIKNKKIINENFLYYLIATEAFTNIANAGSSGTRMPRADWSQLKNSIWNIPETINEQIQIASILSSLDDKIELNLQMNQTLEAMAQALFKEWFVKNVKDNLEEITFGEKVKPQKGKNITKLGAIFGEIPVVAGGLEPSCYHNESNTKAPVITISSSGANAGFIRLYHTPVWSSDSCYIDSTIYPYVYFCYIFLKMKQKKIYDSQEGSAQPHIYPRHIMALGILNYDTELIEKFEKFAVPIFEKIKYNSLQIQSLTQTRDTLLPKLMSGQMT